MASYKQHHDLGATSGFIDLPTIPTYYLTSSLESLTRGSEVPGPHFYTQLTDILIILHRHWSALTGGSGIPGTHILHSAYRYELFYIVITLELLTGVQKFRGSWSPRFTLLQKDLRFDRSLIFPRKLRHLSTPR